MELQRVKEIEQQIARNELSAAQVLEKMKRLVYRDAPCKAFCEGKAYRNEIARLKHLIDDLTLAS